MFSTSPITDPKMTQQRQSSLINWVAVFTSRALQSTNETFVGPAQYKNPKAQGFLSFLFADDRLPCLTFLAVNLNYCRSVSFLVGRKRASAVGLCTYLFPLCVLHFALVSYLVPDVSEASEWKNIVSW